MMRRMTTMLVGSLVGLAVLVAAPPARADEPVTTETCATCHDEVAANFLAGPHGRAMAKVSKKIVDRACVACHGPAAAHVEDPSTDNIVRKPTSKVCVQCHADRRAGLELTTPAHVRNGVGCLDCHQPGHAKSTVAHMLRAEPAKLCGSCHTSEAAAFNLPYAHREGAHRPFACTQCHDPHGQTERGRLKMLSNGGVCIRCHTEKAGPFVYPHPPREVDGCVTCHEPHGSMNPRQLTRRSMSDLCLECHADVPAFHDLSQARYRACQRCHQGIHGSNRDPRLFE
jgi:Doubled CXXCH motif (Paired_CXXCH_1).